MPSPIAYRPMEPADAEAVSQLIADLFTEVIGPEYTDEGRAEFLRHVQPAAIVELRDNDHVSLLFVDTRHQRHGIARELLERALAVARPAKPGLLPAYERLGFRQTGPERIVNGRVFIPMALTSSTPARSLRRSAAGFRSARQPRTRRRPPSRRRRSPA